ncbi:MAG: PD40 domain-containing protein [Bacteroidaceae bacterium]|nr:PD40 domain-containing protein [Bacteroidaceae bacterium]
MNKGVTIMAAMALSGMMLTGCNGAGSEESPAVIGKSDIKIEGGLMTPEALWAMGRVGSPTASPDGNKILYGISYYSVEQNKSHHTINIMNADGSDKTLLTTTAANETGATWIKGGSKIAFLSNEGGSNQVWEINPDGSGRKQLTNSSSDIEGFLFSPCEAKVILIKRVKIKDSTADLHPDLAQSKGIIINDLMYKHWDEWITDAPHPFVATFDGNSIDEGSDLLEGTAYDCPNRPFGGVEQLAWSADSKQIAYSCIKKTGVAYTLSTDTDIFLYNTEDAVEIPCCNLQLFSFSIVREGKWTLIHILCNRSQKNDCFAVRSKDYRRTSRPPCECRRAGLGRSGIITSPGNLDGCRTADNATADSLGFKLIYQNAPRLCRVGQRFSWDCVVAKRTAV